MKISIWDMDFFYKKSFLPNIDAMQISSFHKQLGDSINFITESYHIKMEFDLYYIIRNKKITPRPPSSLIEDKRVKVLGKQMIIYDNYFEINEVIGAVRPDYLLYPEKEKDAYYNANLIRFYVKNKLVFIRQPIENQLKYHKKTLVVDLDFWDHSTNEILFCLNELQQYKNIAFDSFIQLKKIIQNEKISKMFLKLNFSRGTLFKFKNDFGWSFSEAKKIFDYIKLLREKNPSVFFGRIPFKTTTTDHWDEKNGVENGLEDLLRSLQIIDYAKQKKIHVLFIKPDRLKLESPFWYYFEGLEYWTDKLDNLSYIEYMLNSAIKKLEIPWYAILNDPLKWITPNVQLLLRFMVKFPDAIKSWGYRQWGDKCINEQLINWNKIKLYQGEE